MMDLVGAGGSADMMDLVGAGGSSDMIDLVWAGGSADMTDLVGLGELSLSSLSWGLHERVRQTCIIWLIFHGSAL